MDRMAYPSCSAAEGQYFGPGQRYVQAYRVAWYVWRSRAEVLRDIHHVFPGAVTGSELEAEAEDKIAGARGQRERWE